MPNRKSKRRLNGMVTPEMKDQIEAYGREKFWGKGFLTKAYVYFVGLAVENPGFPIKDFDGDATSSCIVENKPDLEQMLKDYSNHPDLKFNGSRPRTPTAAFGDALARGLSIHVAGPPKKGPKAKTS